MLPLSPFNEITVDLADHPIARLTPSKSNTSNAGIAKDEEICRAENDFFDYSTNHHGNVTSEHQYISLCGDNKAYFRKYWDFKENVQVPIFEQDFVLDNTKGILYLKIGDIHKKLIFPCPNKAGNSENFTAVVKHTPTNSNFWHFSIIWLDAKGQQVSSTNSKWKKPLIATIRAKLLILFLSTPPTPLVIDKSAYQSI